MTTSLTFVGHCQDQKLCIVPAVYSQKDPGCRGSLTKPIVRPSIYSCGPMYNIVFHYGMDTAGFWFTIRDCDHQPVARLRPAADDEKDSCFVLDIFGVPTIIKTDTIVTYEQGKLASVMTKETKKVKIQSSVVNAVSLTTIEYDTSRKESSSSSAREERFDAGSQ